MSETRTHKRCAFSCGNDSYIPNALVSLLSFKRHNPDVDLYVLASGLSNETSSLCLAQGVKPIEVDLRAEFHTVWEYGRECFYHFKGPEIFASLGYEFSIYIDGDIYCNASFPEIPRPFHIAGTSYNLVRRFFEGMGELEKIEERLLLTPERDFDRPRLQSGVLAFNNQGLTDLDYFEKVRELYERSIRSDIPRKGDDSLLALTVAAHRELQIRTLPRECNLIDFKRLPQLKRRSGLRPLVKRLLGRVRTAGNNDDDYGCVVYHFVSDKPWLKSKGKSDHVHRYFRQKWLEVMLNHFDDAAVQRCYPQLYKEKVIAANEVNFYWYPGEVNFGDWITPYLVKQVSGRDISTPVDPHRTREGVIIGAGSIMRLCGSNTIVWGSGIRDRYQDIAPGRLIRSVRGPLTRQRVLEVGGECPPVFGDPALLLPRFYTPSISSPKYKLGIIPHVSQYERVQDLYEEEAHTTVIDLRTRDIEAVVDRIAECECIVSSSLHGIIMANAYQIPVRWIQFDNNIRGDGTKFSDHFASIGRPNETPIDALVYKKVPSAHLIDQIVPYEIHIDLDALWEASMFYDGDVAKFIRYVLTDHSRFFSSFRARVRL